MSLSLIVGTQIRKPQKTQAHRTGVTEAAGRFEKWGVKMKRGSGGRKSPSGVQGQSPGRESGASSPRSWCIFHKQTLILVRP